MTVQSFINPNISPLKMGDSSDKALRWMEELHCQALPVVDENNLYKGLLYEDTLLNIWSDEIDWDLVALQYNDTFLYEHQPWQDAVKLFAQQEILVLLSEEGLFLGAITPKDVLQKIGQTYSFREDGSVLVLALNQNDYSLSEISRLVESNNAKILHLSTDIIPHEPFRLLVTLKINQIDISRIIATFERFNYEIAAKYHQALAFDDVEQERLGLLFKYLSF
jgi:hypothetical protein